MVTLDDLNTAIGDAELAANAAEDVALQAADARFPVQDLAGSGSSVHVISTPGSYYLRGDITGESGKFGIEIASSNVTLDLNGFQLIGVVGAVSGIRFTGVSDYTNVTIRNGIIRDWPSSGISSGALFVRHSLVEDVTITGSGLGVSGYQNSTFSRVTAASNTGSGISGTSCIVDRCIARSNGSSGFSVSGVISDCLAISNTSSGFSLTAQSTLSNCQSSNNTGDGYNIGIGSTLTRSMANGNGGHGFNVTTFASNTSLLECQATGNGTSSGTQAGFQVSTASVVVDGCFASSNTEHGFNVSGSNNLIVRNRARSNPTSNFTIVASNNDAQVITSPGTAFVSTDPWANFAF